METLHLTLHRKWFNLILQGIKKKEYREIKPYWIKRLLFRKYRRIKMVNGYGKDRPFMVVELKKIEIDLERPAFVLHLGEIVEVGNMKNNNKELTFDFYTG